MSKTKQDGRPGAGEMSDSEMEAVVGGLGEVKGGEVKSYANQEVSHFRASASASASIGGTPNVFGVTIKS